VILNSIVLRKLVPPGCRFMFAILTILLSMLTKFTLRRATALLQWSTYDHFTNLHSKPPIEIPRVTLDGQ
jgi:hypothetical protein